LENAQNDCVVLYDSFSLIDAQWGRLKRTVTFHGHVFSRMSLKEFPFDNVDLHMKFISICNWRTLDQSRHGNDPCNQLYILEPMADKAGVNFFLLGWGGKVNEFNMLGWSREVVNSADNSAIPIIFTFKIHLVRMANFYIFKVLFPLWIIVLTSLAPYALDTRDAQGRLELVFTLLLTTIALLYVVQESIPKISFLTLVDKIVIATLLSLALSVLFCVLISTSSYPERLNWILATANQVLYWVANIFLIVPPYLRYRTRLFEAQATQRVETRDKESGYSRKSFSVGNFN